MVLCRSRERKKWSHIGCSSKVTRKYDIRRGWGAGQRLHQEREKQKVRKIRVKKKKKNPTAKMLKKNTTIALRGTNRGGCEISYKAELKKVLPNGTFPEVQGGWEL